jgi:hypothetical protein
MKIGEALQNPAFKIGSKVLSRAALPVAIGAEIYDVAHAKNKGAAAAKSAGGLAGGWAGAEIGAAIGTAILPGIGTAIGGALGGIVGYTAGKKLVGKVQEGSKAPKIDAAQSKLEPKLNAWSDHADKAATTTKQFATNEQIMSQNIIKNGGNLASELALAAARTARIPGTGSGTLSFGGFKMYAEGGFTDRPAIFGEAGGGISVTFAPVIHGAGTEIIPALRQQQELFMGQLQDALRQSRRVSYDQ